MPAREVTYQRFGFGDGQVWAAVISALHPRTMVMAEGGSIVALI